MTARCELEPRVRIEEALTAYSEGLLFVLGLAGETLKCIPNPGLRRVPIVEVSQNRLLRARLSKKYSLLTRAIVWDRQLSVSFYVRMFSTRTRPFKFLFYSASSL